MKGYDSHVEKTEHLKLAEEMTTEKPIRLQTSSAETHLPYADKSDFVRFYSEKQLKNTEICISVKQTSCQRQQLKIPVE